MSCHRCCIEFGVFTREHGCEICGFAFCGKCCNKKTIISEAGEKKRQILCDECFNNLRRGKPNISTQHVDPPSALEKRLAFGKHSFSLDVESVASSSRLLTEKDKEIGERLYRLKRERNKELVPSQVEIEERLAKLKGMDPSKYTAPPIMVYRPSDKRSGVEQVKDLIEQIEDEVKIEESIPKPEDEIAKRLACLKGTAPTTAKADEIAARLVHLKGVDLKAEKPEEPISQSEAQEVGFIGQQETMDMDEISGDFEKMWQKKSVKATKGIKELSEDKEFQNLLKDMKKKDKDEDIDEEEEANMLIEKLMSADINTDDPETLDSLSDTCEKSEESDENAPEEFPWCVICTEDAKIKCFGCSGDLYCLRCFRECHDSLDIKDHKTCTFQLPKM